MCAADGADGGEAIPQFPMMAGARISAASASSMAEGREHAEAARC